MRVYMYPRGIIRWRDVICTWQYENTFDSQPTRHSPVKRFRKFASAPVHSLSTLAMAFLLERDEGDVSLLQETLPSYCPRLTTKRPLFYHSALLVSPHRSSPVSSFDPSSSPSFDTSLLHPSCLPHELPQPSASHKRQLLVD